MAAKSIPTILVLGVLAAGWLAVHKLNTGGNAHNNSVESTDAPLIADTVTLSEGKLKAGGFQSAPVKRQLIQDAHIVPGRIRYDEARHVEVKAPMDGILTEVLVTPGEYVENGQLLAVIRSPEIGQARAEILKRQKQKDIAQSVLDRQNTLAENLEQLSAMLDQHQPIELIEKAFTQKSLGGYRQELLAAYARKLLASALLEKVQPLANSGAISGRIVREREAERQIAEAAFRSARDQATFTATQAKLKAEADVAEADRQVNLALQAVETLLGCKVDKHKELNAEDALSQLEVRAPFAGSVESRAFASNERVRRADSLIVLANTESLYVAANIRESDWSAISLQRGTNVSVTVPALDDRQFDAVVHYFGRQVASDTNSVPLVATVQNTDGLLRPGMFVRMTVPVGRARDSLSVKPESVIQHENQQFVFVDRTSGVFQRVDISTGLVSDDWVEVTEGLSPGQKVVTDGAFLLKSELLLQGE